MASRPPAPDEDDDYPYYEDTVTESSCHFRATQYIQYSLEEYYRERADVFVGANNFVYWQKGHKEQKQAPDVYVCFGVSKRDRRSYKLWEENGIVPQVIFEITSESSRFTDLGTKKAVYEMLGVEEYYAFDPLGEYIPEKLRAFRSKQGMLSAISGKRIHSPRLNLDLRVENDMLRLFHPGSSVRLLTYHEAETARKAAEQAREAAEQAREAAEQAREISEERAKALAEELKELKRRLGEGT